MAHALDLQTLRSQFPALTSGYLYADNAGGSQCLSDVVSRISDYLLNTNVQLGADYSVSQVSTRRVAEGVEAVRELFNAEHADEVALGSSSTMLAENLARALEGKNVKELLSNVGAGGAAPAAGGAAPAAAAGGAADAPKEEEKKEEEKEESDDDMVRLSRCCT